MTKIKVIHSFMNIDQCCELFKFRNRGVVRRSIELGSFPRHDMNIRSDGGNKVRTWVKKTIQTEVDRRLKLGWPINIDFPGIKVKK